MPRDVLCRGWAVLTREPLFLDLEQGQPLVLIREPGNVHDGNAIIMADLYGQAMSYANRHSAAWLAPRLDAKELWLARCKFVIGLHMRDFMAVVWRDSADGIEEESRTVARPRPIIAEELEDV